MSYTPVTWRIASLNGELPWGRIEDGPLFYERMKAENFAADIIRQTDWTWRGVEAEEDGSCLVEYVVRGSNGEERDGRVYMASLDRGELWEIDVMWDAKQDWFEAFGGLIGHYFVERWAINGAALSAARQAAHEVVSKTGYSGFGEVYFHISTTRGNKSLMVTLSEAEIREARSEREAESDEEVEP